MTALPPPVLPPAGRPLPPPATAHPVAAPPAAMPAAAPALPGHLPHGALGFDFVAEGVAGAPGLQGRFIGLRALAWVLTVLFAIEAWAVLGVAYGLWRRAEIAGAVEASGWTPTVDVEWEQSEELLRFALSALLVVSACLVPGLVLFSFRAIRNLRAFGHRSQVGSAWAVFGWFVPVVNLFMPKRVVNEAWRGAGPPTGMRSRPPAVFLVWWLCFIVAGVVARGAAQAFDQDGLDPSASLDSYRTTNMVTASGLALLAVSALAGIATFREVARRQHERADHLRAATRPG